jgi:hypothetical protein
MAEVLGVRAILQVIGGLSGTKFIITLEDKNGGLV